MTAAKKTYDLTRGPILNRLLLVAIPIMGTQVMQMAYNLTDMFWLGRLGSEAVAASGAAGMFMWLSMSFMMFGRMGAEICVSQNLGAGDREAAKRYSQTAVLIAAAAGALYGCAMIFFSRFFIGFFNIREANVAADAARYLSIMGISCAPMFIALAVTGTFTGAGNSRLPFLIHAIGIGLNLVLDPVLIFTFGFGITGAAVASALSQTIVCVLFILAVLIYRDRPFESYSLFARPDPGKIRRILKLTTPIFAESFLFTGLTMTISRFIASFGASALAVSRVGSQIESLSWLIGGGFASAVTAFTGQNYGARRWSRIHACFRMSCAVMCVWGLAVTLLLFTFGRPLYGIFLKEPEILEMGAEYMRILAFCQLAMCLEGVGASIFRGIGETVKPSVVSITSNIIRVPLAYLLSRTVGLTGVWIAVSATACLRGVWISAWYIKNEYY